MVKEAKEKCTTYKHQWGTRLGRLELTTLPASSSHKNALEPVPAIPPSTEYTTATPSTSGREPSAAATPKSQEGLGQGGDRRRHPYPVRRPMTTNIRKGRRRTGYRPGACGTRGAGRQAQVRRHLRPPRPRTASTSSSASRRGCWGPRAAAETFDGQLVDNYVALFRVQGAGGVGGWRRR